jgi:Xaa-Pro aminopeptidase
VEVHEAPRLNNRSEEILKAGSVVTIEPGIYLPDQGGIRIEDMYVVRDDGLENLNSLSTDIMVVKQTSA